VAKKVIPIVIAMCVAGAYTLSTRKVAYGTYESGVFRHPHFGLTLQLPRDWYVMSDAEKDTVLDASAAQCGGMLAEAEQRTALLLVATRYPPGEMQEEPNCMLMCGAEKLPWFSGVGTGAEYLARARENFDPSKFKAPGIGGIDLAEKTCSRTLGGLPFEVLDVSISCGFLTLTQRYYATVTAGNALFFVLTFFTDQDESDLKDILAGMKFE